MKEFVTGQEDDKCDLCDCSLKVRVISGIVCLALGVLFCFISFVPFHRRDMATFAVVYVLGTILGFAATFFFRGWKKQLSEFTKNNYLLISGIVILVALVLLILCAFTTKSLILCLLILVIQWVAQFVYAISSFPGGPTALKAVFSTCL